MVIRFLNYKFVLSNYILILIFSSFLIFPNTLYAQECILAKDSGSSFSVLVKAKPELVAGSGSYSYDSTSQRANWTDTGLYTNGDTDGFYIEIQGKWNPWGSVVEYSQSLKSYGNEKFCTLKVNNIGKDSENVEIGQVDGEFDHIQNAYDIYYNQGTNSYSKILNNPLDQTTCWLTAGEGLYIAFFGQSGDQLPEVATHLKAADIICPSNYANDYNGDKIITLDECRDSNGVNMAYYTQGMARCQEEYYHGASEQDRVANKIGVFDCYSQPNDSIIDKTIFIYETRFFYDKKDRTKVGKNSKIKLIIYDRYYEDNVGAYNVTLYKGVSDGSDRGLIEKIISDLETLFVGSRNSDGSLNNGILFYFYTFIVTDSVFAWIVRIFVVIYITFLGLSFAMGILPFHERKHYMGILFKLAFILSLTSPISWKFYDTYFVRFFLDGFSNVVSMISNISTDLLSPNLSNGSYSASTYSSAGKFAFIDNLITTLFSRNITLKIWSLCFEDNLYYFGVLLAIPIVYFLILYYIFAVINASFPYIIFFIQAVLALAMGPIFILFLLFEKTKYIFKNWVSFLGGRFLNIALLFVMLFAFSSIIGQEFIRLFSFEACKDYFWNVVSKSDASTASKNVGEFFSFGLQIWGSNLDTRGYAFSTFSSFFFELLYIYLLIKFFISIMKKLPNIVDSMVSIDDTDSSGFNPVGGSSKLGDSIAGIGSSFSDAINKSIKVNVNKNGKRKEVGLFESLNLDRKIKENVVKVAGIGLKKGISIGSNLAKKTGNQASKLIYKDDYSLAMDDPKAKNLFGQQAVEAAAEHYKKTLEKQGFSGQRLDNKLNLFSENAKQEFLYKPMKDKMDSFYKTLRSLGGTEMNNYNFSQDVMKNAMATYYKNELSSNRKLDADFDKFINSKQYKAASKQKIGNGFIDSERISSIDKIFGKEKDMKKIITSPNAEENFKALIADYYALSKAGIENRRLMQSRINELTDKIRRTDKNSFFGKGNIFHKGEYNLSKFFDIKNRNNSILENMARGYRYKDNLKLMNEIKLLNADFDNINQKMEEIQSFIKSVNNEPSLTAEQKNVIFTPNGINADTFNVKGIQDLGFGPNNVQELLGFGGGAGAAVMGSEMANLSSTTADNDKQKLLEKMEQIKIKIESQTIQLSIIEAQKNEDGLEIERLRKDLEQLQLKRPKKK